MVRVGERKGDRTTDRFGLRWALARKGGAASADCGTVAADPGSPRTSASDRLPPEGRQFRALCEAIGRDEGAESALVLSDLIRALYLDETSFHFGQLDALGPKACQIAQGLLQGRLGRNFPLEYWEQAYAATVQTRVHAPDDAARQPGLSSPLHAPGATRAMPSAMTQRAGSAHWAAWVVGFSLAAIIGLLLSWILLPQDKRIGRLPSVPLTAGRTEHSGAAVPPTRHPRSPAADASASTAGGGRVPSRSSVTVSVKPAGRRVPLLRGRVRAVRRRVRPLPFRGRRYARVHRGGVSALFGRGVVELPQTPDANTGYLPGT